MNQQSNEKLNLKKNGGKLDDSANVVSNLRPTVHQQWALLMRFHIFHHQKMLIYWTTFERIASQCKPAVCLILARNEIKIQIVGRFSLCGEEKKLFFSRPKYWVVGPRSRLKRKKKNPRIFSPIREIESHAADLLGNWQSFFVLVQQIRAILGATSRMSDFNWWLISKLSAVLSLITFCILVLRWVTGRVA